MGLVRHVCLLVVLAASLSAGTQDLGLPPYKYFSPQDYKAASRNWSIVTDTTGIVYVANEDGVLRYNGVSWSLIELPEKQKAYWVERDAAGRIYVGANGNFGVLLLDENGKIRYTSLSDQLPEKYQDFNVVWEVVATGKGVTFRSRKYIFRYFDNELTVHSVPEGGRIFDAAYAARDTVFFRVYGLGLAYAHNGGISLLPGSEEFAEKKVNGLYAFGENELLIATRFEGLYIYGQQGVRPFKTDTDDYLLANKIYDGHLLENGNYALATMANGLVIITPQGQEVFRFDSSNGLENNATLFVTESEGQLWLATKNGIFQMAHQAPYKLVEKEFGLKGQVTDIFENSGGRFVTCNDGLYQLVDEAEEVNFKVAHENTIVDCVSIFEHDNTLHVGSLEGVFRYKNEGMLSRVSLFAPRTVVPTVNENVYLAAEFYYGLYVMTFEANQLATVRVPGIDRLVDQVLPAGGNLFWVRTIDDNFYEIQLAPTDKGWQGEIVKQLKLAPNTYLLTKGERLLFITGTQLYSLVDDRLVEMGDPIVYQYNIDRIVYTTSLNDDSCFICYEDAQGSIYCEKFVQQATGSMLSTGDYLYVDFRPNTIFEDPESGDIWLGGADGVRIFSWAQDSYQSVPRTIIRQLDINNDSIVSTGLDRPHSLAYYQNNLQVSYVSNSSLSDGKILFQYRLLGGDENWSPWTGDTKVIFSNLRSGDYQFQVRSRSPYSGTTATSALNFEIRRPWYLTGYAFSIYTLLAMMVIYGGYRLRVNSLVRSRKELAKSVASKTRELAQANAALQEKAQKLEQLGEFKSRFFSNVSHDLRTPIALLSGRIQMLQSDDSSRFSEKADVHLDRLEEDAKKLVSMVDDIQELVQLQDDQITLHVRAVAVEPYFKSITSLFESSAKDKNITLRFRSTLAEGREAEIDPHCIERVLYNLVSNALKFTKSGGTIQVLLEEQADKFQFSVIDSGVGIPTADLDEIFNRNFQAKNQLKESKGLGLGLNVVRELVQLHAGEVGVQSKEGQGSTFTVSLPWRQSESSA